MASGIWLPYSIVEDGSGVESFSLSANGNAPPISPNTNITTGTGSNCIISGTKVWVADGSTPAIKAWLLTDTGAAAASNDITGGSTLLQLPKDVAIGSDGKIYVADSTAGAIFVFAANATGNVAPITTITGATTTLVAPQSIALDSSNNIYVIDNSAASAPSILKFTAGASGDVAPATTITDSTATLTVPFAVRLDTNNNIWVSDDSVNAIYKFAAGAAGSTAPTTVLNNTVLASTPTSIGFDGDNNLYVLIGASIVCQFAEGAMGGAAPATTLTNTNGNLEFTGLAAYGTPGTCIPFELQTPSQLLDEGQLAVIRRIFIDINCMVETGFAAQTLTPVALTDLTETTLATISTNGRQTVEIAFQQSARQFSLRLTGCLKNRIELFGVELDVALTGSEVTQS